MSSTKLADNWKNKEINKNGKKGINKEMNKWTNVKQIFKGMKEEWRKTTFEWTDEWTNKYTKEEPNKQRRVTDKLYLPPQFLQILSLPLLKSKRNYSKEDKNNVIH